MPPSTKISRLANAGLCAALLAIMPTAAPVEAAEDLAALLAKASRDGHYRPVTEAELRRAEEILTLMLSGQIDAARPKAAELGYEIRRSRQPAANILVEAGGARHGRPLIAVRDQGSALMLQIPHAFKDELTREIGLSLFAENEIRIALWNTVPRRYERAGREVDADMAHLSATWFTALTQAFARHFPSGRIVQLHGFDTGKRKSAAGASADFVLSNGTKNPSRALRRAIDCLGGKLPAAVRLYPEHIRELGGTTNAQVAALRLLDFADFMHVEINRPLRESLNTRAAVRAAFSGCLFSLPGGT